MIRRHPPRLWAPAILFGCALMLLTGCPEDPYDPQTWIKKLDDPTLSDQAVTELQRLKDPVAIKPLAKTWTKQNRPQKILRAIVELAERTDNGGPHWTDALPVLRTAVDEFDVGDARSVENAILAADALGRAQDKEGIPVLIRAANKSIPKLSPGQRVRLSAIAALGKFGEDQRAIDALVSVLNADVESQPPQLFAAASLALADARNPSATVPLLKAMYKIPPIYQQTRRALVAIGKPVIPELKQIFELKHKELNELAKEFKFNKDCEEAMGPDTKCVAPTNLEYKAAMLLGDMRAKDAVPMLIDGLKKKALPSYFENGLPGPSQHAAILDALRKIGDSKAADPVYDYMFDSNTDDLLRPLAIDVYSFVTTDTKALEALGKRIKDDEEEEQVRMASGLTYARLARDEKDYEPLVYMAERYKKEADKNMPDAKKANDAYEKVKKAFEEAEKKALQNRGDTKLVEAAKKAREEMKIKEQDRALADGRVAGYRNFQRTFEQHLARAHAGVMCKSDPKCYVDILEKEPDALIKGLDKHIKDLKDWTADEKKALKSAMVDRALIEISKMGEKGRPAFDKLLELVDSTDRITREGVMIALVHVAPLPCEDKCVKRLDEVIAKQKEQSTLQSLVMETEVVRNYFLWAGK